MTERLAPSGRASAPSHWPRSTIPPLSLRPLSPLQQRETLAHQVRRRLPAWAAAGAGSQVQSWIRRGFRLPWLNGPCRPFHQGTSFSDLDAPQRASLEKDLQRLLDVGALEPGKCAKYVTRAFLVPKAGGKWRLVIDLRHVNSQRALG